MSGQILFLLQSLARIGKGQEFATFLYQTYLLRGYQDATSARLATIICYIKGNMVDEAREILSSNQDPFSPESLLFIQQLQSTESDR